MESTPAPAPRDPDWLKGELRRLTAQKRSAQDQLGGLMETIDAIDNVIEARLGELSRALKHLEASS